MKGRCQSKSNAPATAQHTKAATAQEANGSERRTILTTETIEKASSMSPITPLSAEICKYSLCAKCAKVPSLA